MGFRQGSFAKIWDVERREKFTKLRISISKKNKQTGQYESDFTGFVALIGKAHQDGASLAAGDVIKIGECEVTNRYDKEKQKEYTNFNVYSFEDANSGSSGSSAPKSDYQPVADDGDDGELPF